MALNILKHNRAVLEETAQALLETEVLEGDALKARLERVEAPMEMERWLRFGTVAIEDIHQDFDTRWSCIPI